MVNVFFQKDVAKNAVRESNGVQLMVALLKRDDPKLLIIIADCLRILAVKNQPTKMIILQVRMSASDLDNYELK